MHLAFDVFAEASEGFLALIRCQTVVAELERQLPGSVVFGACVLVAVVVAHGISSQVDVSGGFRAGVSSAVADTGSAPWLSDFGQGWASTARAATARITSACCSRISRLSGGGTSGPAKKASAASMPSWLMSHTG